MDPFDRRECRLDATFDLSGCRALGRDLHERAEQRSGAD
jgi:hypothetical protein